MWSSIRKVCLLNSSTVCVCEERYQFPPQISSARLGADASRWLVDWIVDKGPRLPCNGNRLWLNVARRHSVRPGLLVANYPPLSVSEGRNE